MVNLQDSRFNKAFHADLYLDKEKPSSFASSCTSDRSIASEGEPRAPDMKAFFEEMDKGHRAKEIQTSTINPALSPLNVAIVKRSKKQFADDKDKTPSTTLPEATFNNVLAISRKEELKKDKVKVVKNKEFCNPRIEELAIPQKRRVYETWKAYSNTVPPTFIINYQSMLKAGKNLNLKIARCHFKKLEKLELLEKNKKKATGPKNLPAKHILDKMTVMADAICKIIRMTRPPTLNMIQKIFSNLIYEKLKEHEPFLKKCIRVYYKKLEKQKKKKDRENMIKKGILPPDEGPRWKKNPKKIPKKKPVTKPTGKGDAKAITKKSLKQPRSKSKSGLKYYQDQKHFDRTLRKISDILAYYANEIVQTLAGLEVDSQERIILLPLHPSKIDFGKGIGEEESEESEESEEEEGEEEEKEGGEGEGGLAGLLQIDDFMKRGKDGDLFGAIFGEGGEGEGFFDRFGSLSEDILAKLISILEKTSPEDLARMVDEEMLPGVTFDLVLAKLHELKKDGKITRRKPYMEAMMIDWANRSDPDRVDQKVLDKIKDVSQLLNDLFLSDISKRKRGIGMDDEFGEGFGVGEGGEGLDGADGKGEKGGKGGVDGMGGDKGEGLGLDDLAGSEIGEEEEDLDLFLGEGLEYEGEDFMGLMEEEEDEEARRKRLAREGEEDFWKRGLIPGHKPKVVYEHTPGTVCCLSLKLWAIWLLEITKNALKWAQWLSGVIQQIRHYVAVVRGDVKLPNGETKILRKDEWAKFARDTEETAITWREYNRHVKKLSDEIISNFQGKPVNCCPKCMHDMLIKNVISAHETLQALAEAINCAEYWQRCLDDIVEQTAKFTKLQLPDMADADKDKEKESSDSGAGTPEIEELSIKSDVVSVYEIELVPPRGY